MPNEIHESLVIYRLNSAKEKLRSAKLLLDNAQYKDSIGRSYYAIFSAVRAVLALDEVDFKKHAGVISYFQKTYIKTKVFDKKYSRYLMTAFQIRNNADYADFYIASANDAKEQYKHAEELLAEITAYLVKRRGIKIAF